MGHQVEFELGLDKAKDSNRTVFWTIKPLMHSEGTLAQRRMFSVVGRDISVSVLLEENNRQLEFQMNRIQAILDSALQGFLTFGSNLKIDKDFSKRTADLLGSDLAGRDVCDVLKLNRVSFSEFSTVVFLGTSWDLLKNFSKLESEVDGKILNIELVPIIEDGKVKSILAAITDVTQLTELQKKAEKNAQVNRTMVKVLQSKSLFLEVIRSVGRIDSRTLDQTDARRVVHTWKGEFSFFGVQELVDLCHAWEDKWKDDFDSDEFQKFVKELRLALEAFLDQYDDILNIRSAKEDEILISLERVKNLVRKALSLNSPPELMVLMENLLESPIKDSLSWLNEVWLTAAEKLGKKVNPIQWKDSVPIFAEPYKKVLSMLVHAVRNAADHGIEYAQERVTAGKQKHGTLTVQLELKEGNYHLKLKDDGRGLNAEKIKQIAEKKGLPIPTDNDVSELIFQANFSTAEHVTEYSGRGVGLDAVRAEARMHGGDAKIRSLPEGGLELTVIFRKKTIEEIFSAEI